MGLDADYILSEEYRGSKRGSAEDKINSFTAVWVIFPLG